MTNIRTKEIADTEGNLDHKINYFLEHATYVKKVIDIKYHTQLIEFDGDPYIQNHALIIYTTGLFGGPIEDD